MGTQPSARLLHNPVSRYFQARLLASGTAAGSCEALSMFKDVTACQTSKGKNDQSLFSLSCYGACNVRKMIIDFPFPNSYRLGKSFGGHLLFIQEGRDPLPQGLRVVLLIGRHEDSSELIKWIYR